MPYEYIKHPVNGHGPGNGKECRGLCCNPAYSFITDPEQHGYHKALVAHNIPIHVYNNGSWATYYILEWMNKLLRSMIFCGNAHGIGKEKAIELFAKIYKDKTLNGYWSSLLTLDPAYLYDRRRHRKPFTSLKLAGYEVPSCKIRQLNDE